MRVLLAFALAALCAGCVTASTDIVSFTPKPGQETLIRDGVPAVISKQAKSQVMVWPSERQIVIGARPNFTISVQNLTKSQVTFIADQVAVEQIVNGEAQPLKVFSYDELATEERQLNTNRVLLASIAGGLNSYSAGNSYWQQAHASRQNEKLAKEVAGTHRNNMAALEGQVMKSHTLMPGETHVGRIVVSTPAGEGETKSYVIRVKVGADSHEVVVTQKRLGGQA